MIDGRIMDAAAYRWMEWKGYGCGTTMNVVHHTIKHGRTRFGNHETFMDGKRKKKKKKKKQSSPRGSNCEKVGVQRDT